MVNKIWKDSFLFASFGGRTAIAAGVDGCRGGWLAVLLELETGRLQAALGHGWADLPLAGAAMIAVDMPIGLADRGPRVCDIAARRLLPPGRKSSVFPAPRRAMLACADWAEANALGKELDGCGLSRQAWNITAKIKELDQALDRTGQERIREVHPELVFARLNAGRPVPPKRSAAGRTLRLQILAAAGLPAVEALIDRLPRGQAQPDDALDAAACALAARDILAGTATRLPADDPPRDARGLRMEIWF